MAKKKRSRSVKKDITSVIANGKQPSEEMSKARVSRAQRWWELHMMGVPSDVIGSGDNVSAKSVDKELKAYLEHVKEPFGRSDRLRRHIGFSRYLKSIIHDRLLKVIDEDDRNGGMGLKKIKKIEKIDPHAFNPATGKKSGFVKEEEIHHQYLRPESTMLSLMKELREIDRYEATLDGLMAGAVDGDRPTEIVIDVGDFFSSAYQHPKDAPQIPAIDVEALMKRRQLTGKIDEDDGDDIHD